jgi:hypothetical protein
MTKKGLNQIPERKADESNILSYTVSGTLYNNHQFHKQLK